MTFEEFFKKKKINLTALQQAEGAIFTEFKQHYELMGEKSFDHTKKYWFNKLRRLYPAPVEAKVEKVVMENQLAEQTITETLTDPSTVRPDTPKTGFTPRFKASATAQPATPATPAQPVEPNTSTEKPEAPAPKPGFTPRFKPGVTASKPTEPAQTEATPEAAPEEKPAQPKVGFTPRFKAGVTASKPVEPANSEPTSEAAPEENPAQPKVGFTPRFKAGVTASKPEEPANPEPTPEAAPEEKPAQPKVGFTPRFKAGVTASKPAEPTNSEPTPEATPEEKPAQPKVGFTPRFKAGVIKSAPNSDIPPEETDIKNTATITPEVNKAAAQQQEIKKEDPDFDLDQVKPGFEKEKEAAQQEFGTPERAPHKISPEEFIEDKGQAVKENTDVKPAYKPRFRPPQK